MDISKPNPDLELAQKVPVQIKEAYLNIEEVLYNYILGMEDEEVEKYFH